MNSQNEEKSTREKEAFRNNGLWMEEPKTSLLEHQERGQL